MFELVVLREVRERLLYEISFPKIFSIAKLAVCSNSAKVTLGRRPASGGSRIAVRRRWLTDD